MSNDSVNLINTRLQPGVPTAATSKPFQRLCRRGKTVETVLFPNAFRTGLKPGVNENGVTHFFKNQ